MSGNLGEIESNVKVIGFFGIVVDDKYLAVNTSCAMMTLTPDTTNVVTVDELPYLELTFEPGSTMVMGLDLVKTGAMVFNIYDEIIVVGLGIDKGAPDGKGKIVGFNYPRIQSYDPLGTYVMSSALGFKSPQYVYSRITNAKPTRIDTIGSFIMNDGVYTDTARLFVGDRRIEIAFGDYGTPVYYKENNNNIISEFKINSKFYK